MQQDCRLSTVYKLMQSASNLPTRFSIDAREPDSELSQNSEALLRQLSEKSEVVLSPLKKTSAVLLPPLSQISEVVMPLLGQISEVCIVMTESNL